MEMVEFGLFYLEVHSKHKSSSLGQLGHNTVDEHRITNGNFQGDAGKWTGRKQIMTMDFGQLAVDKLSDSLKLNNTESNSNYHRSFQDIGVGEWDVHISRKHYKCAERALKNGEFQTTLKHLKRCLQRTPDWPEVYLLKSRTYEKFEDYASAIECYRIGLALIQMNEINSEKNTIKEQQSAPDQFKQASDTELKQSRELKWNMNMTDSEHGNQTGGCAMLPQLIRLYFLYYQSLLASGSTDMAQLQLPEIRTLTDKYCSREQNTTHIAGCSPGQVIIVDKLIHLYQKGERDLAEGIQVLSQDCRRSIV
ncbi:hypothetical protein FBUS_01979 [Fasciolopsis buskii]|uniref:Uncharacterized protein n=1 Tax=Fasciolopsis buskii TaxID=27845 RepID=A0A8E0S3U1_9TREM|nr:hypothetical protein FBUS_01979 [Fasciolopsis buski]